MTTTAPANNLTTRTRRSNPVVAVTDMHIVTVITTGAVLGVFARQTQWDTEGHHKAEETVWGLVGSGAYKLDELAISRHELR